jgi:hypothetical protein
VLAFSTKFALSENNKALGPQGKSINIQLKQPYREGDVTITEEKLFTILGAHSVSKCQYSRKGEGKEMKCLE